MFQTIAQVAIYATILGVFITIATWLNGRRTTREIKEIINEMTKSISEQISRISEQISRVSEQISHSEESTKQILVRMDEKMNELLKRGR